MLMSSLVFVWLNRSTQLHRLASVKRDGTYVKSNKPPQLSYGTLTLSRQSIVHDAYTALSCAVTIAVRYSAVRRQFGRNDGTSEIQVFISVYFLCLRDNLTRVIPLRLPLWFQKKVQVGCLSSTRGLIGVLKKIPVSCRSSV